LVKCLLQDDILLVLLELVEEKALDLLHAIGNASQATLLLLIEQEAVLLLIKGFLSDLQVVNNHSLSLFKVNVLGILSQDLWLCHSFDLLSDSSVEVGYCRGD